VDVYVLDGVINDQTKQKIRGTIDTYLKRAEELKNIANQGPVKKKALADDGKDDKDDDDSGDPDRKRMMQKFQGRFF
jgi:hypothetical protein